MVRVRVHSLIIDRVFRRADQVHVDVAVEVHDHVNVNAEVDVDANSARSSSLVGAGDRHAGAGARS
ncbi:MAG: hypothetical protein HY908_24400 [Myxococcales bacterium]|nr:hypothetical protein [Myxococcales bacterium]